MDKADPRWQADSSTDSCTRCTKKFSLIRRRHHCRSCGFIFCASCVQKCRAWQGEMLFCESCMCEQQDLMAASVSAAPVAAGTPTSARPPPAAPDALISVPADADGDLAAAMRASLRDGGGSGGGRLQFAFRADSGEFVPYADDINDVATAAHARGDPQVSFKYGSYTYTLTFRPLQQKNDETGQVREVSFTVSHPQMNMAAPPAPPRPQLARSSTEERIAQAIELSLASEPQAGAVTMIAASAPAPASAAAAAISASAATAAAVAAAAAPAAPVPSAAAAGTAPVPPFPLVRQTTDEYMQAIDLAIARSIADSLDTAAQTTVTALQGPCPICFCEDEEAFSGSACDHAICRGCAIMLVRNAIGDRSGSIFAEGIRCPQHSGGCEAYITPSDCAMLLSGAGADAGASGDEEHLSAQDYETLTRYVVEAAIPDNQKLFCPKCERMTLIDAATDDGAGGGGGRVLPAGVQRCPHCGHSWEPRLATGEDEATLKFLEATSKPCPNCGQRATHYHGHECHHMGDGTGGCPSCKQHWCYVCGRKHGRPDGICRFHPDCTHHQSFCSPSNIQQHLSTDPYPHDTRCGCPICPNCRRGKPCEQCTGSCVVCRGLVPHGPSELVATS